MSNFVRALLLAILTVGAFWPVSSAEFLVYDDPQYVTDCAFVRQGLSWRNVGWAMTTFEASNWHPLMWLSLMLDRDLSGGLSPFGFHATSLAWHVVNALLLFHLVLRIAPAFPRRAFVVALLFAIHPLHVESVAWVSERKDLLFTAFGLLALHAYVSYVRGSRWAYWWSVLCLVLSLMSKSMLLTFPFLLLLLDYWPLGRVTTQVGVDSVPTGPISIRSGRSPNLRSVWTPLVLEKWPMFCAVFAAAITALVGQAQGGAVSSLESLSVAVRVSNAFLAYGLYLRDTIWPADLSVIYQHPKAQISLVGVVVSFVTLTIASAVLFRHRQRMPAAWIGWCWFVGTLVPVIGIVQVGMQQRADRYTYFPLIGLFWGVVWSVDECLAHRTGYRKALSVVTALVLASLAIVTHGQVGYWRSSAALFEHALEVEPQNSVAYHSLGIARERQGDMETAIALYRKALELQPTLLSAQLALSLALIQTAQGPDMEPRLQEAATTLAEIVRKHPRHPLACNLWGHVLRLSGRREEAVTALQMACELKPHNVTYRTNLAVLLHEMGRSDEAQRQFDEARRLDAENPTLLFNLGVLEFQAGDLRMAIKLFEQADPKRTLAKHYLAAARLTLGTLAMKQGDFSEAVREFERSDEMDPQVWQLQVRFGGALLQLNELKRAETRFLKALELHPECVEAHFGLGRVYANRRQREPAVEHLTTALKLKPDFQPAQELLNSLK